MKRAAPIFAVVALLDGCFPDFSGLTGASPDDASSEDVRLSPDADAVADCTSCDAVAEPTIDAPADVPADTPADVPADVFVDEPSPDVTIDPCRRDGGTPGIRISSSSGDFCIDKTEVSNRDYSKFLLAQPDGGPPNQPAYCSWNSKLTPNDPSWPQPGLDDFPVANVDWCDAYAYCKWAGKRLCGRIGGGPVADIRATDPTQSQWYLACAGSNSLMYPYSDTYDPHACNGVENMSPPQLLEVGKMSTCEGRARGLFDMSGNVYEWIDSCEANIGSNDYCRMMGGGYTSPSYELACSYRATNTRDHFLPNAGFRCCTDL